MVPLWVVRRLQIVKKLIGMSLILASFACLAQAKVAVPPPLPPVVFRPTAIRTDEKPVVIETEAKIAADNGLFRRVETTITFTNPNGRFFEGELEFPVPEGATVCGYQLEVNGLMVPGVVVTKEEARVAFENEKRQILSFRLDKPKNKCPIGEIKVD